MYEQYQFPETEGVHNNKNILAWAKLSLIETLFSKKFNDYVAGSMTIHTYVTSLWECESVGKGAPKGPTHKWWVQSKSLYF